MPSRRLRTWRRRFFPPRAPIQTWMILTFALFVGLAVLVAGVYVFGWLHEETDRAVAETLRMQADRVAAVVGPIASREEQITAVREMSRMSDLHLALGTRDEVLVAVRGGVDVPNPQPLDARALSPRLGAGTPPLVQEEQGPGNMEMLAVTVPLPREGLLLRVSQPTPPLLEVVQKTEYTLLIALLGTFLLALLAAWVAAVQLAKPLRTVRQGALRIAGGDLERPIEVDTRAAELQDLTRALNQMAARFRQKIGELRRVQEMQTAFLGNVSHEVRNPIFAVGGYLEALSASKMPDAMRQRYAEKALGNLQRLNALFADLIEISKLEYREDLIHPKVFDLRDLLDEVDEMLRPKADDKQLELAFDENPHLLVEADRNRIRQVLVNLVENAIAYSGSGKVRVRYRPRQEKVRLEVIDYGRGIPEEHLEQIFERFYRVDPNRSRKSGGTGLGLSIVKQILQAHGEAIHVESTVGRGTRFWFELPYAGEPDDEEEEAAEEAVAV